MTQETDQQSEPTYTGRVLPGSRWRQRAFSGHSEQTVTVLRVGQRSVLLVIEGGKLSGHDRQKVGQRFNVVLDTFLRTHTLISQPKGYRPGDEALPQPRKDTVETYFRRRRFAEEFNDTLEGRNVRDAALDPRLPILPGPVYEGDALLHQSNSPPPPEEEPTPVTPSQPDVFDAGPDDEPVSPYAPRDTETQPRVITATDEQILRTIREIESETPDPVQAFIDTGHGAVAQLTTELDTLGRQRDDLLAQAELLDRRWRTIKVSRDRIESAVLAAIAAIEGTPEPEPPEDEEDGFAGIDDDDLTEVEVRPGPPPWQKQGQRHGPQPNTGGTSQRSWVLDRLAKEKRIHVGTVADEFSARWGTSRESSIKNIASILGAQASKPHPQWPVITRVGKGEYTVVG